MPICTAVRPRRIVHPPYYSVLTFISDRSPPLYRIRLLPLSLQASSFNAYAGTYSFATLFLGPGVIMGVNLGAQRSVAHATSNYHQRIGSPRASEMKSPHSSIGRLKPWQLSCASMSSPEVHHPRGRRYTQRRWNATHSYHI